MQGRERLRVRNLLITTLSARKPASLWREKRDTVFILERGCNNVLVSKIQGQGSGFGIFGSGKKAQLPAIRIS